MIDIKNRLLIRGITNGEYTATTLEQQKYERSVKQQLDKDRELLNKLKNNNNNK